jgi:hypothetical protein
MQIVTPPQHFNGVATEAAIVVGIFERPPRDFRSRRLAFHVMKLVIGQGCIDRTKPYTLKLAHQLTTPT